MTQGGEGQGDPPHKYFLPLDSSKRSLANGTWLRLMVSVELRHPSQESRCSTPYPVDTTSWCPTLNRSTTPPTMAVSQRYLTCTTSTSLPTLALSKCGPATRELAEVEIRHVQFWLQNWLVASLIPRSGIVAVFCLEIL